MCKIKGVNRLINDEWVFTSKPSGLIGSHLVGMIWLGIIPIILLENSVLNVLTDIKLPNDFLMVLYFLIFILLVTIAFYQSKNAYEIKQEPTKHRVYLSSRFFISYFIARALFLFFTGFGSGDFCFSTLLVGLEFHWLFL